MTNRKFWMQMRQHWFGLIAAIEQMLEIKPTTKEKLDQWKAWNRAKEA